MTEEFTQDWFCGHCEAPLGNHPRGVELTCSVCGRRTPTPGFDKVPTSEQTKFLTDLKEQTKKRNQERYKAMRER